MKRIFVLAVIILISVTASFARKKVAEGKSYTALGNYKIEIADNPVTLKGKDCMTYVISYENTPMEVTVAISKDKNCKRYVVISDKLSIQYVCHKEYFGVEKLGTAFVVCLLRSADSILTPTKGRSSALPASYGSAATGTRQPICAGLKPGGTPTTGEGAKAIFLAWTK